MVNLAVLGFLEVLRPKTWLFFQIDMFIVSLYMIPKATGNHVRVTREVRKRAVFDDRTTDTLTLASAGGGGGSMQPPMCFSEMASEPLSGPR